MERFLLVCLAGALGSGSRYLIGLVAGQRLGTGFPYGTLIVNLVGCFCIAVVMQLSVRMTTFSPTLRIVLATGFVGGLTTYSAFNYETTKLLNEGARGVAMLNLSLTLIGCFVTGLLGLFVANRLTAP